MLKNRLFFAQALALALVAALHLLALEYKLYWHFVWLDVVSHFLGGVWVVLVAQWIISHHRKISPLFSPFAALVVVLIVGIGWEVFEFTSGVPRESNFVFDSSIDLLMDSVGGLVGWIIGQELQRHG